MIDEIIKVGTTSKIIEVWLADSSSTTGAGLAGLAFNAAGLTAYYTREDQGNVAATAITLATMTRGTWATGGFVEKDATGVPGVYQFSIPDAVLAAGAKWAKVYFKGATNLAPKVVHIALTAIDLYDTVRGGMTALPNAAAEAAGGLYTRGAGAGQINQANNGQIDVNAARTGGTTNTARDIGAQLDATVSSRSSHTAADIWAVATRTVTSLSGVAGDIRTALGLASANLDTQLAALAGYVDTEVQAILDRLGAWTGSGVNTVLGAFRALMRKGVTVPTDIGGTYDVATDSNEAIREVVDLVQAKTTNLPPDPADASDVAAALTVINADTDDIQTKIGTPAGGSLAAAIAALPTAAGNAAATATQITTDHGAGLYTRNTEPPTAVENADTLLDRDLGTGADTGTATKRTPRQALRVMRNRVDVTNGIVYKEDDATTSHTFVATTNPAADPITQINPAGGS